MPLKSHAVLVVKSTSGWLADCRESEADMALTKFESRRRLKIP